jgi:hypothetical protein
MLTYTSRQPAEVSSTSIRAQRQVRIRLVNFKQPKFPFAASPLASRPWHGSGHARNMTSPSSKVSSLCPRMSSKLPLRTRSHRLYDFLRALHLIWTWPQIHRWTLRKQKQIFPDFIIHAAEDLLSPFVHTFSKYPYFVLSVLPQNKLFRFSSQNGKRTAST